MNMIPIRTGPKAVPARSDERGLLTLEPLLCAGALVILTLMVVVAVRIKLGM